LYLFRFSQELGSIFPNYVESVRLIAFTRKVIMNICIAHCARKLWPQWNATSSWYAMV